MGAALWLVHAGSVFGFGFLWAAGFAGALISWPFSVIAYPVMWIAIGSATAGSIALGIGLGILQRDVTNLDSPARTTETISPDRRLSPEPVRERKTASTLCFVHAVTGVGALILSVAIGANAGLAGVIALSNLWFLASIVLVLVGISGGDFLDRFLLRAGILGDPFHLLRWYAAYTALFTNVFLIGLTLLFGPFGLLLPFGVGPVLGIFAFLRVYRLGARLPRIAVRPLDVELPATR